MRKIHGLLASVALVAAAAACGPKGTPPDVETGTFEINENQPALKVILYGTAPPYSTPNGAKIDQVIAEAQTEGTVASRTTLAQCIEGCIYDCVEAPDSSARKALVAKLRAVRTSLSQERYSVLSMDHCPAAEQQ